MNKKLNLAKKELTDKIKEIRLEIGACPIQEERQSEKGAYYFTCKFPDLIENCEYKGEIIKNNGDSLRVCNYIIENGYLIEVQK